MSGEIDMISVLRADASDEFPEAIFTGNYVWAKT